MAHGNQFEPQFLLIEVEGDGRMTADWLDCDGDRINCAGVVGDDREYFEDGPGYYIAQQAECCVVARAPITDVDGVNGDFCFHGPFTSLADAIFDADA